MQQLSLFQSVFKNSLSSDEDQRRLIFSKLHDRIPPAATEKAIDWFLEYPVELIIASHRRSKAGDFRIPRNHHPATITVNGSLNSYSFLITLVHEMAHFHVYHENKQGFFKKRRRNTPHGPRWKECFRKCMASFMLPEIFPAGILTELSAHLKNPGASVAGDVRLSRILAGYDKLSDLITLENLPEGVLFSIPGGKLFTKQGKMRKRYRCFCITNGKTYLFSPVARVYPEKEKRS